MSGPFVLDPRIGVASLKARFKPHHPSSYHFRLERGKQPEIVRALAKTRTARAGMSNVPGENAGLGIDRTEAARGVRS